MPINVILVLFLTFATFAALGRPICMFICVEGAVERFVWQFVSAGHRWANDVSWPSDFHGHQKRV